MPRQKKPAAIPRLNNQTIVTVGKLGKVDPETAGLSGRSLLLYQAIVKSPRQTLETLVASVSRSRQWTTPKRFAMKDARWLLRQMAQARLVTLTPDQRKTSNPMGNVVAFVARPDRRGRKRGRRPGTSDLPVSIKRMLAEG